jgi:hypothetical protein
MFEISVRAWSFSGVIRLCRERETPVSWKEIAKRKQEDRDRQNAETSRADAKRVRLREELPSIFVSIVDAIAAQVESYNAELPLKSDGITVTRTATTARFHKASSPAASLELTLSGPSERERGHYAAVLTTETVGLDSDREPVIERGYYEISINDLGPRFMQRGRDLAYSDLTSVQRLVDSIITPLVYLVS